MMCTQSAIQGDAGLARLHQVWALQLALTGGDLSCHAGPQRDCFSRSANSRQAIIDHIVRRLLWMTSLEIRQAIRLPGFPVSGILVAAWSSMATTYGGVYRDIDPDLDIEIVGNVLVV